MRILIRTSKIATWARRLGSFVLPLMVLSILMHRGQMVATETFHLILVLSFGLASLAFLLGLIAVVELWFSGDKGWSRALTGFFLGGICLSPLLFAAIEWRAYPMVFEVSTNPELFVQLHTSSGDLAPVTELEQIAIDMAFPNATTRDYQIDAVALYGIVETLVNERQWDIVQKKSFMGGIGNVAEISATAMTVFGWRDDVVIRITNHTGTGTLIDMRSAAKLPGQEFGRNGKRIEEFLVALDEAATEYARDNLAIEPPPVPSVQRDG